MEELLDYTKGLSSKKVLIFGLGLQGGGVEVTKFFAHFCPQVKVTDLKTKDELTPSLKKLKKYNLSYTLGGHKKKDIAWADIVLVNQDVWNKAPDSPYIKLANKLGKAIETQTGLFFQLCQCPIIGVTGTRGKTTTATAIYQMLKTAKKKAMLGGNIPYFETLNKVVETDKFDYAVLELSNFQLRGLHQKKISPHIAVVTSVYPDHLISYPYDTFHQSMKYYLKDKQAICQYQTSKDYRIIKDSSQVKKVFSKRYLSKEIIFNKHTLPVAWQLKLQGEHNRENLAAAYCVGKLLNIKEKIIKKTLTNFKGVAYRLQIIAKYKGITFVNDTTSTSPAAAQIALKSFKKNKIIWICGGYNKYLPQQELIRTACQRVYKYVFLAGTATDSLIKDLKNHCFLFSRRNLGKYSDFSQAITKAYTAARANDIILLSPGFASFGMFKNEFERGKLFNQIVQKIIK